MLLIWRSPHGSGRRTRSAAAAAASIACLLAIFKIVNLEFKHGFPHLAFPAKSIPGLRGRSHSHNPGLRARAGRYCLH